MVAGIVLITRSYSAHPTAVAADTGTVTQNLLATYSLVVAFFAFPTIGAIIISRRPSNTVGWLFCLIGIGTAYTSFDAAVVAAALANHTDTSLLVGIVDALGNLIWGLNISMGLLLLMLFPNGKLPSRRWRPLLWLTIALIVLDAIATIFKPGALESDGRVRNPLGITGVGDVLAAIDNVAHLFMPVLALAAVISLVVRFVKSRDAQRQQIKWFVYGVLMMVVIIVLSALFIPETSWLSNVTFALGFLMLPLGAGIGVLRYKLFDIDIIINRTLVYGLLTVILAGIYFGGVVGAQSLFNVITRRTVSSLSTGQSPVLIVVTTLLIAALFQPLRRRLQQFIDHRFYRSRYDAKKTLDRFGASLRSEVELAHLTNSLLETVDQTMRPAHTSLWLRTPESER